jgi:hypothetical protein
MIVRFSRWFALALTSALVLSACAAKTGSTIPSVPGFGQSASVGHPGTLDIRVLNPSAQPNVACPKRFAGDCHTVSKANGLELGWCYGPKADPCSKSNAGEVKWSGLICLAAGKTCHGAVKVMTGKFTGPFKCTKSLGCKGTWELDTITPGSGLQETTKYLYKQSVKSCATSCITKYVGLNVGP